MKYLFLGGLLLSAAAAQAQISADTRLLSADAGYSQTSRRQQLLPDNNTKYLVGQSTEVPLQLTGGYFVAENLMVGLQAGYTQRWEKAPTYATSFTGNTVSKLHDNETTSHTFSVGPAARYYRFFGPQLALYGQLGAGYQRQHAERLESNNSYQPPVQKAEGSGYYAGLAPGLAYFPIPRLALELNLRGLSYSRLELESKDTRSKTTYRNFDAGLRLRDLRVGLSLYLGRQ
ncbi:outer membrane protein [Hymenobacter jeollabukensis]|uniref:Outer membrane protein beta-barrel domain-containing protein n=1 Tax=Hymenobacter jeollabukensis TaxID=2025313 RepID=A0A5R8WTT8_9BACT|nr:outer membrane beta-barrel protein [Hymenobacter jeollabukensis]TLM95181.1 hypothetical protein FDY95_05160 [Hymenobacter jeollabukensis]